MPIKSGVLRFHPSNSKSLSIGATRGRDGSNRTSLNIVSEGQEYLSSV